MSQLCTRVYTPIHYLLDDYSRMLTHYSLLTDYSRYTLVNVTRCTFGIIGCMDVTCVSFPCFALGYFCVYKWYSRILSYKVLFPWHFILVTFCAFQVHLFLCGYTCLHVYSRYNHSYTHTFCLNHLCVITRTHLKGIPASTTTCCVHSILIACILGILTHSLTHLITNSHKNPRE